jgi:tRNA1Val (adenine37-N6)-methyltransferase
MEKLTSDTFFNGRLRIRQQRSGYRFSIDAVLLAYYARPRPGDRVLDLGTGCGIVPLIMVYRCPQITVYGIEVQKKLSDLARFNVSDNHMETRVTILHEDMKSLKSTMISGLVDLVVSNPPYRRSHSGRLNPNHQRAVARHEIIVTLSDLMATAKRNLRTGGRFVTIYSAERAAELLGLMRSARIEPKFLRSIHSNRLSEAKLILVEGKKGAKTGIRIESSLILYDENGNYTEEVEKMFAP